MARNLLRVDVTGSPELLRIAEEVRRTGEARVLQKDDEDVAIVVPIFKRKVTRRRLSDDARAAFLSSAGGWKDVDTDALLDEIYRNRRMSDRPSVDL